jgi:hypothetical protein
MTKIKDTRPDPIKDTIKNPRSNLKKCRSIQFNFKFKSNKGYKIMDTQNDVH